MKYELNTMALNRHMDYHFMDLLGVQEEVLALIKVGHFSCLLDIRDEAFHPLTLEFVCTLNIESVIIFNDIPTPITIHANDKVRTLTMNQFALLTKLYTVPEIQAPSYSYPVYWTDTFPYKRQWRQWSDAPKEYEATRLKASHL